MSAGRPHLRQTGSNYYVSDSSCPWGRDQALTNRTGHPVISIPNGFSQGSPTTLHLTGKLFGEQDILLLAHAFQAKTDFHLRYPSLKS